MITNINIFKLFESYLDDVHKLNEGLIQTHDINKSFKILSNSNFWILDSSTVKYNKIYLNISKVDNTNNNINIIEFTNLLSTITNLGYFISKLKIKTDKLSRTVSWNEFKNMYYSESWFNIFNELHLVIEPKYDILVDNIPNKLYHLTYDIYKNKIIKNGLIPKSKNVKSYHLDRVYFSDSIDGVNNFYKNKKDFYNFNYDKNKTLKISKNKFKSLSDLNTILLEIDTTDLNIKLYKDPNFNNGYYTTDNIDSKFIKIRKS